MNVIDLVQSLEMGRKSCSLTLTNRDDRCEVCTSIKDKSSTAAYGNLMGDEAVFKVLRWTDGNFQVNFDGKTTEQTTKLNTQGLLMEGLRLRSMKPNETPGKLARPKKMSSSTTEPFTTAVLTISDSCARGEGQDLSGPAVAKTIQKYNFTVSSQQTLATNSVPSNRN